MNKIFGVGLNKTGTTSIAKALEILGFDCVHWQSEKKGNIKDLIEKNNKIDLPLLTGIEEYDAYFDWNHPRTNHLFKKLDHQYPDSKFILHTRPIEDWINSRYQHVSSIPHLTKWQKKYPDNPWYNLDVEAWKIEYEEHHNDVRSYFKDRPDDLLVFDLFGGDSWKELCDFLQVEKPKVDFPIENKASEKIGPLKKASKKLKARFKF